MKQVFKGKELTTTKVVNKILKVYDGAKEKETSWYVDARLFALGLSVKYNKPLINVCAIIAALSPLKSWTENKKIALLYFETGEIKHTKGMAAKVLKIDSSLPLDICEISEILNGLKITSFFLNIYQPQTSNIVTIDRHAISICLGYKITDNFQMTSKQYEFFRNCYIIAAEKRNVLGLEMQAATWVIWRKMNHKKK